MDAATHSGAATVADDPTTDALERILTDEIHRMYSAVADHPEEEHHFFHGREAAQRFGYPAAELDAVPDGAVASFAGVGNPHLRAGYSIGETVVDLGSGAGLDPILAARAVGPEGRVIGVDLNPLMRERARAHGREAGVDLDIRAGRMEAPPVDDGSADVVISNGVVNLSFRKRKVMQEMHRILRPGGRLSLTDIVSAKQLSQSIVNDPKLWAS